MPSHSSKKKPYSQLVVWASVLVVLAAIAFGVILLATKQAAPNSDPQEGGWFMPKPDDGQSGKALPTEEQQKLLSVRQDDWVRGEMSAPVTLIEYSDFQCPACGSYYPIVRQIEKAYSGKVRIVYRQYPLASIHAHALRAAAAAEAAGQQGKFWEMHDALFEHQSEWSPKKDVKPAFLEYAKTIGLDEKRFVQDMESDTVKARVKKSVADAERLRLQGTPTFFLNGKQLTNPRSFDDFRYLIENAK